MALYFEDIQIGATFESQVREITEVTIRTFAEMTGDMNAVHLNPPEGTVFRKPVAHGPLVIGLAMGLAAELRLFEGTAIAPLDLQWSFSKPVYLGDTIRVRLSVTEKRLTSNPGRGLITRQIEVLNQTGEIVQKGTSRMLIKSASAAQNSA
jgi:acyl dehydratase